MTHTRRDVLMASAAAVASAMSNAATAQTLNPENQTGAQNLYGTAPFGKSTPDTSKFITFQNQFTAPPKDLNRLNTYLQNLPLTKDMTEAIAAGKKPDDLDYLVQWNHFALDLLALDHTKYLVDQNDFDPSWAEQVGPPRSSRALAIIHVAMAEAVNFIFKKHQSYHDLDKAIAQITSLNPGDISDKSASVPLAISWSAYETMRFLFPRKQGHIKAFLSQMLHVTIKDDQSKDANRHGTDIGRAAARAALLDRSYDFATGVFQDGSRDGEQLTQPKLNAFALEPLATEIYKRYPGQPFDPIKPTDFWIIDPISQEPPPGVKFALGGDWFKVRPFVLKQTDAGLFLPKGPPDTKGSDFDKALVDVREYGGDSEVPTAVNDGLRFKTKTKRTGLRADPPSETNETFKAQFWGYDATAFLCAPPRLYNMITTTIAFSEKPEPIKNVWDLARYLALVNLTLADAALGGWTAKFKFHFARPAKWIRTHNKDDVHDETANEHWTPLGQVNSNAEANGRNTTPPFPAYPSGHATFGGALFECIRLYFGTKKLDANGKAQPVGGAVEPSFKFVSDEYNGLNRDPGGDIRPFHERTFKNWTDAETENARSRVWLGVHWQFDADDGVKQGREIAAYVFGNALQPK